MTKKFTITLFMFFSALALFGCYNKDRKAVAEMQKLIQQNLNPGDSAAKIEAFFKAQNLPCYYDKFIPGYGSVIPSSRKTDWKGVESVIMITIYVNDDHSFKNADVRMSYTYL